MDSANDDRLWMDKYQPKKVDDLTYNKNITDIIKAISQKEDFPHLIFYGPDGAGKKTRIRSLLSLMFGPNVHKIRNENKEVKVNTVNVEYLVSYSNHHIGKKYFKKIICFLELTPSDSEHHDRIIVQKVIKETAGTGNIDQKSNLKIIVLHDIDNLTKEAQAALRRTMEKYMNNCRLIMCCSSLTKIIPPIRSRCLSIRVPSPSNKDIRNILERIKINENVKITEQQLDKIVSDCDRNVRRAINCFQLSK